MNKIIYKLRPCDEWRIGEHESWFQDMAKKGLHLVKLGRQFAKFKKGEPAEMRYRIEVSADFDMNFDKNEEMKYLYRENGWDYVTGYGDFYVFSSPNELDAPELHTDSAEQAYTLKSLWKKHIVSSLFSLGAALIMLLIGFFPWFINKTPILTLIETSLFTQIFLSITYIYYTYSSLKAAISIRILQKSMSEGRPINHNASWKKHKIINDAIAFIYIIMVVALIASALGTIKMGTTKELPLGDTNLPVVRLSDIEKSSRLVRKTAYTYKNIDYGNSIRYGWSPLAPKQYISEETGMVPGEIEIDGREYLPSVQTRVYKLTLPFLADKLAEELIMRHNRGINAKDYRSIDDLRFDSLIIRESSNMKEVFAYRNNVVIYVRYSGKADMSTLIENVSYRMSFVSH
ncbi:hypothetical protein OXPF_18370 [Oxobacter pfennigii]|uniref:DUF2812 domain-containing protein n=1 Tax=Oxobacter pfennigii TaxID=36849 RepID=A0A0P8YC97_9CLOT|nr:DUF2812 domain-containing protein [Oxobacter pfennigii]KPU44751.1 hypothetical protein OXPF_18370 [Oxobacter pfennigii]